MQHASNIMVLVVVSVIRCSCTQRPLAVAPRSYRTDIGGCPRRQPPDAIG